MSSTPPAAPPQAQAASLSTTQQGWNLFLVGFLVLFLELACIRWFAAHVIFLQFFTNVVLIACFLGMSCGCLAAKGKRDWLAGFPLLGVVTFLAALVSLAIYHHWKGLAVSVGNLASPQEVFFGTEYRNPDVAQFVVPIELVAALFFVLVALLFVGLGQVLGRAFDAYPDRVRGYMLNIGGSLAGIVGFTAISFVEAPPVAWFFVALAGVAYLLHQGGRLTWLRGLGLAALLAMVATPITVYKRDSQLRWSPYYAILYEKPDRQIIVNTISHQAMVPYEKKGATYSLVHLLQQHSGGKPFEDVLVIGAGSGNDVAHALRFGARRVDAVEIDPVILDIGAADHPDRPYQDPRVVRHLDDGRHFLRTTDRKYDLVVYALVDSLILHSSYANIRLESFLFTRQALEDVKRVLKPDGTFVMYNCYRQGWIVHRAAAMAQQTFGRKPVVLNLPFMETLRPGDTIDGFTVIVTGNSTRIARGFATRGTFWLNQVPPRNEPVDGFAVRPGIDPPGRAGQWERIAPSRLIAGQEKPISTSDDWPFLYLKERTIPDLSLRSTLLLGALGVAMVYFFLPKVAQKVPAGKGDRHLLCEAPEGQAPAEGWSRQKVPVLLFRPFSRAVRLDRRMFFLGAAFMLLETKAVVHLALLFGSTWLVNSAVFFSVLVMILLANLYVLKASGVRLAWHYAGLLALLAANVLIPLDVFLGGGIFWRYVVPCALLMGPVFFAGVIFARLFRDCPDPDRAFGSNIAGSVVGGFSEALSMLLGFRYLLLVAMAFYLLSAGRAHAASR